MHHFLPTLDKRDFVVSVIEACWCENFLNEFIILRQDKSSHAAITQSHKSLADEKTKVAPGSNGSIRENLRSLDLSVMFTLIRPKTMEFYL